MKILYLYAKHWYDRKMSIGRWLYGQAVANHPGVELRVSGVGWDGWQASAPVSHNILRMDWIPDLIWVYKPQEYAGLASIKIPRVMAFNEANDVKKTSEEIEAADPTKIIFHHQNDIPRWELLRGVGVDLIHLPHCAPCDLFAPSKKTIDCLSSGVQSPSIYPIRHQLHGLVQTGQIPGVIRKHPGYRLNGHEQIAIQYGDYANQLAQTKIALCCTSIHKYFLAKLVEAAAAGCVIATDMPHDPIFQEYFGHGVIEMTGDVNRDRAAILSMLDDPLAIEEIGERNRQIALGMFDMKDYARRFVEAVSA